MVVLVFFREIEHMAVYDDLYGKRKPNPVF